MVKVN
jgi:hypothetical protein